MRTTTLSLFAAISTSSAAVILGVACGGGTPSDAKDPTHAAASSEPSAAPEGTGAPGAGGGETSPSGGGTTTTQLDASDLQGAKLGSSSRKEIETRGPSGPHAPPGGKSDEPGRRVEDIRTLVMTRRDEARACYDKALATHPGIEGDLDVKWVIDPQGNVSDVAVDTQRSSIHEPSVGACIVDVIKKMKFAASQKGFETRAHYPFNFHPKFVPGAKDAGK